MDGGDSDLESGDDLIFVVKSPAREGMNEFAEDVESWSFEMTA
jgi:hypothetical protein